MITIRTERPVDASAREGLLDLAYGPERHRKPSARLRKGRKPADGLAFVAFDHGRIIGTVRL
jgi:predicted N-acetyltransferase YhbS